MISASPTRAVVLAAGLGTRMRPLSHDLPKALMPLWGRPMLAHTLDMLRRWGVREVLVNLHHQPGELANYLRAAPVPGLRISLSFEPEILGTGGALRRAAWFLDDRPFWLINADVAADLDCAPLIHAFQGGRPLAAVWLEPDRGPRTVETVGGRVTTFASRRAGAAGTATFCGLHLLAPRILDYLPEKEAFYSIIDAYRRARRRGEIIAGVRVAGSYWADIGTPEQYLAAHGEILMRYRRGAAGRRLFDPAALASGSGKEDFVAAGNDVAIARGARLRRVVLWPGARIGSSARLENAVVGRATWVTGAGGGIVMRADRALDSAERAAMTQIGWSPATCTTTVLGARGSQRTFTRIRPNRARAAGLILIRYDASRVENTLYAGHARFLARLGLRVPEVRLDWPEQRLTLLEDLGSESLQERLPACGAEEVLRLYRTVLDDVIRLHERGAAAARRARLRLMLPFDAALYRWEREYFIEHMLQGRLGWTRARIEPVRRALRAVARRLQAEPCVLIHRDLQSSNIFIAQGRPALIDFQGMRLGPAAYDLASLLCDPYACLPAATRAQLLDYYAARARSGPAVRAVFPYAASERLAQALGAYARLSVLPGMAHFARYIVPGARLLGTLAAERPEMDALRLCAECIVLQHSAPE